jgi:hypothetical protein
MSDPITYQPAPQQPAQEESRGKQIAKGVGKALLWRLVIGGIILVIGLGYAGYKYLSGNITAKTPAVGECVTQAKSDADIKNVKAIDCTDAKATDKVVGVLADKTEAEAKINDEATFACKVYPATQTWIFMEDKAGSGKGTILCLAPNK